MKSVNPEYKHHDKLKAEFLIGYEHDEHSKKSFNKKYNKFIVPLLLAWLILIPSFFIFKFEAIILFALLPIPLISILLLKLHQAKFSNASCRNCGAMMKKENDPIVGIGQKLYRCESCKRFFCISYAQQGSHSNRR